MKKKVVIGLEGCDDNTDIEIYLTEEQQKFVRMLAALSRRNSDYSCQPVMAVYK